MLSGFEVGRVLVDEDLLRGRLSVATPMEMMSGATTRDLEPRSMGGRCCVIYRNAYRDDLGICLSAGQTLTFLPGLFS